MNEPAGAEPFSELRFDGRVAIVTGAGRGIGRAHALLLARRGANVVVNDLGGSPFGGGGSKEPAEEVVAEISDQGGTAVANYGDVSSASDCELLMQQALDQFGRIDIVVNNAGIARFRPFASMSLDEFDHMMRVHANGTFLVTKAAWPHMVEQRYGRVIMTSSNGMLGTPHLSHYGAAKAAVYGLMKSLSLEGQRHGITVNAIWPNAQTPLSTAIFDQDEAIPEELLAVDPSSAPVVDPSPSQIAPVVAWLAHESCDLTGEVLHAGFGAVSRVFVAQGPCFVSGELSVEAVRDAWTQISQEASMTSLSSTLAAAGAVQMAAASR